MRPIGR